ncbi:MAG: 30S ribosomal protein S8 [Candidatus Subteraquimicrobiales bacterium]|nr:30S ribosomal protein S8 [Candidatus Subteraquimicrobiales bacterium]
MLTDPIADMLTRIRNANSARHSTVDIPTSKMKLEIARVLKEEGFIVDYELAKEGKHEAIRVKIKFSRDNRRVISGIRRISKPSLRVYADKDNIPKVLRGLGVVVLSTSKGIMTDKQARKEKVGGEVLCYIW